MKKKQLRVCFLGCTDALSQALRTALQDAGYSLVAAQDMHAEDLVIDSLSKSAVDVRAVVSNLPAHIAQYILLSSHQVYWGGAMLRPWCEEDASGSLDMSPGMAPACLQARAAERELRILSKGRFAWTALRPSHLEGGDPSGMDPTLWLAERVWFGGVVALPEGNLPTYRHVSLRDVTSAILCVAGNEAAFDQAINVTNAATLSYAAHAAMVRDGLDHPVRFVSVPRDLWHGASLRLPMGEAPSSTLIRPSPLLRQLGWLAEDPLELVIQRARAFRADPKCSEPQVLELERELANQGEQRFKYHPGQTDLALPQHSSQQWRLRAWSGQPSSLTLTRSEQAPTNIPAPIVRVTALALMASDTRFLRGEYQQSGQRVLGNNALLKVLSGEKDQGLMLAMTSLPCDDPQCPWCAGGASAVVGIACDGYGIGVCTTPPSHMLPVPPELGVAALLANPLGCLTLGLGERLAADQGPVWIAGRTVEAALACWLVQDAGRPVRMVDRRDWAHDEFPVVALEPLLTQRQKGEVEAPTLALDFSGIVDVSWPLSLALVEGGHIFVRRRPPGIAHGRHWHELPVVSPSRQVMLDALARLARWSEFRSVAKRVGPRVPLDLYWDALLPSPFSLPWIDAGI